MQYQIVLLFLTNFRRRAVFISALAETQDHIRFIVAVPPRLFVYKSINALILAGINRLWILVHRLLENWI
jgi:REP element-mobilizing transposase RayT